MIPLRLTLKNFLSYQDAILDFQGIHTACICGANGAGKSSLLEAITWATWGQSRAVNDDNVIHTGADFVRVDFEFICYQQTYRIIRTHYRSKNNQLEFQVKSNKRFRSLSGKGVKATQAQILSVLKLDYDTFINSAYLRQGRADEFMLRKPNERKQTLATLLKLEEYEDLSTQAKDLSRQYKGQAEQLERQIQRLQEQLNQQSFLETNYHEIECQLNSLQNIQNQDRETLQKLQTLEQQRQIWQQQLTWQQEQYTKIEQNIQQILPEKIAISQQIAVLETLFQQADEITLQHQNLIQWQQEEMQLSETFQRYQEAFGKKQKLEQQLQQGVIEFQLKIKQLQTQWESLDNEEKDLQKILITEESVKRDLETLHQARKRLKALDQLQMQVSPLLQRKYQLEAKIQQVKLQWEAQLEQFRKNQADYQKEIARRATFREQLSETEEKLQTLDNKKIYHERVAEKATLKDRKLEHNQAQQQFFEQQIEELKQKIQLLEIPEATCPLCEQALDESHRHFVLEKTNRQQQIFREKIWIIQEEITQLQRELNGVNQEADQLKKELALKPTLEQNFNQIEDQLERLDDIYRKHKAITLEIRQLEDNLRYHHYAQTEQTELAHLRAELQRLNYDEQTHSLVRSEVDRLRWTETRNARLEDAKRRRNQIHQQKPQLLTKTQQFEQDIQILQSTSALNTSIEQIEHFLTALNYDQMYHQNLSKSLRTQLIWQAKYQDLRKAKQQHPELQNKLQQLTQKQQYQGQELQQLTQQIAQIAQKIQQSQDHRQTIQQLEQKIQEQRKKLDILIANKGKIEQSRQQLANFYSELQENKQQLTQLKKQIRIYYELAQAFGKNGIQALMIENILPQLEAESNQILSRLTGNQLHIQFVTQKATRQRTRKAPSKLIDTLDIQIADASGTRTYETYSGGEAFRINFAIRLALAKLLAQRMGTALQMLIIDEGFGTQDGEGCERLIAAINAIAPDFACILTITHMPQFKEAFQNRIEVYKTNQGSQLHFST